MKAKAILPTTHGAFGAYAFKTKSGEHFALVKGNAKKNVLTRVHSSCLTGDVFHSLKCDCHAQLNKALSKIRKGGIIIYLDQEGRGIGLYNKIRAYALQDKGFDTFQANLELGFKKDERDYSDAAKILKQLGVESIVLLTNNPNKVRSLKKNGVKITKTIPLKTKPTKYNRKYLEAKKSQGQKL